MKNLLAAFFLVFITCTLYGFVQISRTQNEPYMDEIFHIPQARKYCVGNYSHWDPMITTLPGLYLMSVGLYKPLSAVLQVAMDEVCSSFWLRATNLLFASGNFYLLYALMRKLHNPLTDMDGIKLSMTTLALSIFPVLHFFTFLYYTDAGSTFFVLLMYLFCLHDNHVMASLMGIAAIMFRQTNIAWVIFVAGLAVRKELSNWMKDELVKKDRDINKMSDYELLVCTFDLLCKGFKTRKSSFKKLITSVLKAVWVYILLGIGFIVFVLVNNGIVVGDRTQHTVALNIPQLFYFLSMTNFFSIFHLCSPYKIVDFVKFCWRNWIFVVLFIALSAVIVHYLTYEHKYLLADNRHYTFYIWSKIYRRHKYAKFALIPAYLFFAWSFSSELKQRDVFWKIVFCLAVVITTVPQKLLEFRYFILPYLIFRINMRYGTATGLLHEILLSLAVNVICVYLFIEKPFRWAHEDSIQRFMW